MWIADKLLLYIGVSWCCSEEEAAGQSDVVCVWWNMDRVEHPWCSESMARQWSQLWSSSWNWRWRWCSAAHRQVLRTNELLERGMWVVISAPLTILTHLACFLIVCIFSKLTISSFIACGFFSIKINRIVYRLIYKRNCWSLITPSIQLQQGIFKI